MTNDLTKEQRTDGKTEVSYHTKPPSLRAVHLGGQRVFKYLRKNPEKKNPGLKGIRTAHDHVIAPHRSTK